MAERIISWGDERYQIQPDGDLTYIDPLGRTMSEWRATEGVAMQNRIETAIDELGATGFFGEREQAKQRARVEDFIQVEALRRFDPAARLGAYSVMLARNYLKLQESPNDPGFELAASSLFEQKQERWIIQTINNCYPNEAAQLQQRFPEGMQGDTEAIAAYEVLYQQALVDFGFVQARGRSLYYLAQIHQAFEVLAPWSTATASIREELATLQQEAASYGISPQEVDEIFKLAAQARETNG